MKKNKAVFVTIVMSIMLVAIDAFLYKLSKEGFIVLTGTIMFYGYVRCAADFCGWLCKDESKDKAAKFLGEPAGKSKPAVSQDSGGRKQ